jgi:3-dehydroquinate dehydratase / shikimate dehydrogenase
MMNNGKICVSVCAETADELIEQIKRAEDLADMVEIRFDCLNDGEFDSFLKQFKKKTNSVRYLATFRSAEQGGKKNLSFAEREEFWRHSHIFEFTDWADLEEDISEERLNSLWGKAFKKIIKSNHDLKGVPENLLQIYENLSNAKPNVLKIAVQANDITDTIPIWKLLKKATAENQQIIPIAMGESGKWTRILGLAHGAFMTYAALDAGQETAPGQVSARDLIEVYRVKELDEKTEVYGIVGGNTSYSMSPYLHNAAFKFHNLNAVFVPLQTQNLDEFIRRMVKPETREIELNFKGFAVTIPHKQNIIKHLDAIDETARVIGAVNTVKIENGKLYGYNTDAQGFIEPLLNSYGDLAGANVAVFGAGGAARACVYALKKEGARATIFARDLSKAKNLAEEFEVELKEIPIANRKSQIANIDVLVNTTPLGTKGELENESIVTAEQLKSVKLVYDLVYNPFQTRLMSEADKVHVPKIGGLAMLVAQAIEQQKIWTGLGAPMREMSRAVLERLK